MTTNAADIVEEVRRAIPEGCVVNRCRKGRCTVSLRNAPEPRVLIDLDHREAPVGQNDKRCDYIFIGGSDKVWVAPMELKSGKPEASEIAPQLQAGADVADGIVPRGAKVEFRPLAIYGGSAPRDTRVFRNSAYLIRFRSQSFEIKLRKCRTPLALALR